VTNIFVTLLLFGLPLFFFPFGSSFFEVPKVILAQVLIEILFLVMLFKGLPKVTLSNKKAAIYIIFTILTILDLIFLRKEYTFLGNPFRLQGIILFWHLLLFSLLVTTSKIPKWSGIFALLTLIGLVISTKLVGPESNGRLVGTIAEPNSLAATAVFLWPFSFWLGFKIDKRNAVSGILVKTVTIVSYLSALFLILGSASRSGLIALIIQIILVASLKWTKLGIKKTLIIVFVLYLLAYGLPFLQDKKEGFENRVEVWQTALLSGLSSPIFGHGFGNIEYALKDTAWKVSNTVRFEYVDSSHNIFLDFWVQGGILGLGALLALLYFTIKNFITHDKKLELTLLTGLLVSMSFNPVSVVTLVAFWWLIGQGLRKQ
jgi:O-antigen ligase